MHKFILPPELSEYMPQICIFVLSSALNNPIMYSRTVLLICSLLLLAGLTTLPTVQAQVNPKDSLSFSMFYPAYSMDLPGADMKQRFGLSNTIGAGYSFLFKNRWTLSAEGNYVFGHNLKDYGNILSNISTKGGQIIDQNGVFANLAITERGYTFWIKLGKLIPMAGPNPNSGLMISAGGGMLQHKYRIENSDNAAQQLRGDYKKGYDHMCNGPGITEFIGYQYIGNDKKINFFAGFEFVQAWTRSRRAYYFNEMIVPDEKRFDMLSGIKIGWIVPMYRKTGHEFYYY